MRTEIMSPASGPALTLDEIKHHLRITEDAEDAYLSSLLETATQTIEAAYSLALILRDVAVYMDAWPRETRLRWWDGLREGTIGDLVTPRPAFQLPLRPVQVLVGIDIWQAGSWQTQLLDGSYIQPGLSPQIYPAAVLVGAEPDRPLDGIRVTLRAGFGPDWNAVPPAIQMALLRLIAHLYEHRGDEPTQALAASGARQLMAPYKEVRL